MKELERPKIEDYLKKATSLNEAVEIYCSNTELFKYTQAVDRYADQIEKELQTLKDNITKLIEECKMKELIK